MSSIRPFAMLARVHRARGIAVLATALAGCVALDAGRAPAHAQGKVDARYTAYLAGIPLGKGLWVIDIAEDQYTAAASGGTAGMLKVFSSGEGKGASRGAVTNGALVPATYASTLSSDKKWTEDIRLTLSGGNIKQIEIEPVSPPNPDRIPVTDAHRRGVSDPMSAALVKVPGTGELVSPEACNRKISVFDGRMRYDVQLAFKRIEQVKTEKGYQGPVVVCAAYFQPLAGYVPDRSGIKYMIKQRDMEVTLAPVAGTRVLALYRFSVPTPLGLAVLHATQFVTSSQTGNSRLTPTPAHAKTQ